MRCAACITILLAAALMANPPDAFTALAIAQRNYAAARMQLAETIVKLQQQVEAAQQAAEQARKAAEAECQARKQFLDAQAVACVDKSTSDSKEKSQ